MKIPTALIKEIYLLSINCYKSLRVGRTLEPFAVVYTNAQMIGYLFRILLYVVQGFFREMNVVQELFVSPCLQLLGVRGVNTQMNGSTLRAYVQSSVAHMICFQSISKRASISPLRTCPPHVKGCGIEASKWEGCGA